MGAGDTASQIMLAILWVGSIYGIIMIGTTIALIDRWRGPHGKHSINICSVITAFLLSTAWPAVLFYLLWTS